MILRGFAVTSALCTRIYVIATDRVTWARLQRPNDARYLSWLHSLAAGTDAVEKHEGAAWRLFFLFCFVRATAT